MTCLSESCQKLTGARNTTQLFFQYDLDDNEAITDTFRFRCCSGVKPETEKAVHLGYGYLIAQLQDYIKYSKVNYDAFHCHFSSVNNLSQPKN